MRICMRMHMRRGPEARIYLGRPWASGALARRPHALEIWPSAPAREKLVLVAAQALAIGASCMRSYIAHAHAAARGLVSKEVHPL